MVSYLSKRGMLLSRSEKEHDDDAAVDPAEDGNHALLRSDWHHFGPRD